MNKNSEFIKLNDIKNQIIVDKIKECTNIIFKFRKVINKYLEFKELSDPQIYITKTKSITFEDDGNTQTFGYSYEVYWGFKYIYVEKGVSSVDIRKINIDIWPDCALIFKFTATERIRDSKYQDDNFFKLYLTGENTINISEKENLVACYNNNYKLCAMLSSNNLVFCIHKINDMYNMLCLKQKILEDLCIINEIPQGVENYISENLKE